jgi:hypothetical protein
MTKRILLLAALALGAGLMPAYSQDAIGKKFGARDPRTCPSHKIALSAVQARLYFICDTETVVNATDDSGGTLILLSDVKLELGTGRPFNYQADSFGWATSKGIDPSQTVYPIRGSFNAFRCVKLGYFGGEVGKNCTKTAAPEASGICFKSSFGEYHCILSGGQSTGVERYPPPTGQ